MPKIITLIDDIHKLLEDGKEGVNEKHLQEFFKFLREDINVFLSGEKRGKPSLRMSSIGKKDRKLWYEFNSKKTPEEIDGKLKLRFFFGNLVESFLLLLAQEAGHKVTDRQKEVIVEGVKGHIDCKIDGVLVDVKSASDFGYRKFKDNSIYHEDPFGYIAQLSGYVQAEEGDVGYFWAYNKNNSEMTLTELDELTMIDTSQRVKHLKKMVKNGNMPERCYSDIPHGKMGNRVIDKNCNYCEYKIDCWKDTNDGDGLRVFQYSYGKEYFTHVERTPKVLEL